MALATLSIDLELMISKLQGDLGKAQRQLDKSAAEMARSFDRVQAAAKGVAVALAGVVSVGALSNLFLQTVQNVDAFNDLADATGASIENISALENVARRNGGTLEDVSGVLVKFNAALKDAKPGNDAGAAFDALGLSIRELRDLDPAEALRRTAVALAGFSNDGNKARLVQELFGKSIREAAPFLKDLAEAGQLNATVTAQQAEEAERFNKHLATMRTNMEDLARGIAGTLVPALSEMFVKLEASRKAFGSLTGALLAGTKEFFAGNVENFADAAKGVEFYEGKIRELDQKVADRPVIGGKAAADRYADERRQLQQYLEYYQRVASAIGQVGAGAGRGLINPAGVGGNAKKLPDLAAGASKQAAAVSESQRALASYVEQLDRVLGKTKELSEEQQALDFLKGLGRDSEIPQVRELVLGLARQVDLQRENKAALEDDAKLREQIARIQNEQLAAERALNEQIDEFTGRLEEARKIALTARLEARLAAGEQFTPEELERAVKGIAGLRDEGIKAAEDLNKRWEQFAENVQDAFGDTIARTLQGDFGSIGRLWKNLLFKMASEAIAADLGNRLFGDLLKGGKAGGGGLDIIGGLLKFFGFAKGGAFGPGGQRLALADGGVLTGPTPFAFAGGLGVAGEAGFEAVMPLRRGRDGKLGVASSGGGTVINNNIYVEAGIQRGEVLTAVQIGMQQVESRIMGRLQRAKVL